MQTTPGTDRLTLRPGTPVLARSPGVLQVGLDEPTARVPDDPAVRRLLSDLARPGGLPAATEDLPAPAEAALARLHDARLVVQVPSAERADPATVTLRAQFGPDAVRRRAARDTALVALRADPAATSVLAPLLAGAGVRVAAPGAPGAPGDRTVVHLVVVTGTVDREVLDPLTRGSVPHLVVTGDAAGRRVGPFVEPGLTACLRCVDAHESLRDPRRPLLVAQAADRAAEVPPPRDPLLDQLALAWAARDVVRYLEGDEPSTWSTTVDIGPGGVPAVVRWGRHPWCGCSWDAVLELP